MLRARWPIICRVHGDWKVIMALVQLKYSHFKLHVPAMMAVNPVYTYHLTEADSLCLYIYHMSGDL